MRKIALIPLLCASLTISACGEQENPLSKVNADQLVTWIYQKKTKDTVFCARQWADKTAAREEDLESCEKTAEELADQLKKGGFGEVTKEDVQLPSIWTVFNEKLNAAKANSFDAARSRDAYKW